MKIIFMRHGQTKVNVAASVHRKNDEATLDETGETQAHKLAIACYQEGLQQLFCSPELRAQQTAGIIATELGLEQIELPEFSERNWGDWSGKPWSEIQAQFERMTLQERYEFVPPNGESWKEMDERLHCGLDKITHSTHSVVGVVTHGGALRALMPIIKDQPKESSFQYDFLNVSITSFDFDGGKWTLVRENDVTHLNLEG